MSLAFDDLIDVVANKATSSAQNVSHERNQKFISSLSVTLLLCFFFILRSSASPFLNPLTRKVASTSIYFNVTCILYIWVILSSALTVAPHFFSHYNGTIAAALFFPMTFTSYAVMLIGRFIIRLTFYVTLRSKLFKRKNSNGRKITMVAFHRPFRRLAKNGAIVSACLSLIYAHCWSRPLSLFLIRPEDGAGAICRVVFTGFKNDDGTGAEERSIWIVWVVVMLVMLLMFAQDEFNGLHAKHETVESSVLFQGPQLKRKYSVTDDFLDYSSDDSSNSGETTLAPISTEEPKDTLDMVPWLSLFAAHSVLDIFLQLKVFLGRVDARAMQAALQQRQRCEMRENESIPPSSNGIKNPNTAFELMKESNPGCIFDHTSQAINCRSDGFWFDFVADVGDGFNSSYQIARKLAQPNLTIKFNEIDRVFPRGQCLFNGGDLAYPNPTEHSFEKRLFRTFEDAMPPPPSFRRTHISIQKPDLPVKGWFHDACFSPSSSLDKNAGKIEDYKGPTAFLVPGNHDWYDGLNTYTRFILCRDWIGGWLMPQQRSYFANRLPEGWWVFGLDCALSADIDVDQYKFFAEIADKCVGPSDAVIIINHEPHWVTDFDDHKPVDSLSERNIVELMEVHLAGKVRLRLAGDLHHYTRHDPVSSFQNKGNRLRAHSFDGGEPPRKKAHSRKKAMSPFVEENKPHLVVSGGGGAFLHGTNTFSKDIKVGPKQLSYTRVSAFPNENVSKYIGWLNMYHFRWRNWRCDFLFAIVYMVIVSSLFPLCGIYDDYEEFNPDHEISKVPIWVIKKVGFLILRVFSAERLSLVCCLVIMVVTHLMTAHEHNMSPAARVVWSLCHALGHITCALGCLLFVQCLAEWVVKEDIVTILRGSHATFEPEAGIAASIYSEYKAHFYPFLQTFARAEAHTTSAISDTKKFSIAVIVDAMRECWDFLLNNVPLLKTTLKLFDLPYIIAQNHFDMCETLCKDGMECMFSHDYIRFHYIPRSTFYPYLFAIGLYFVFLAVPLAGSVFGTWLAVSLNVFKTQTNLAYSSLMIQHWKNFLKLHITKDGDLELFAIGLQYVPTKWTRDPLWEAGYHPTIKMKEDVMPSFLLNRPSKWIPAKQECDLKVVDYLKIPKRRIKLKMKDESN